MRTAGRRLAIAWTLPCTGTAQVLDEAVLQKEELASCGFVLGFAVPTQRTKTKCPGASICHGEQEVVWSFGGTCVPMSTEDPLTAIDSGG